MQGSTFLIMQRSRDFTLQHQKFPGRLELTGVLCPSYLSLATHMSFAPNPLYPVVTKPKSKNVALCRRHTDQPSIQPTKKPRNHPSLLSIQPSIALCSPVSAHSLPVASLAAALHLPNVELPREPGVFELTGPVPINSKL